MRDSFARGTIPRTGNALRHARHIVHVHSLKALEDDSKAKVRCTLLPLVLSVCVFEGHPVTSHMRQHCSVQLVRFVCHSDDRFGHMLRSGTASLECCT